MKKTGQVSKNLTGLIHIVSVPSRALYVLRLDSGAEGNTLHRWDPEFQCPHELCMFCDPTGQRLFVAQKAQKAGKPSRPLALRPFLAPTDCYYTLFSDFCQIRASTYALKTGEMLEFPRSLCAISSP
jgi:hypothetical protein